ncbi:FliG C-terminal domain-containing protein [Marinospirillum perlucidum]|uniref:FliG C-terminal domain-containing protein n=1 Tax=Marinospirillum perlucidum TaxID=1982602 RepID=UPI000DF248E5|nr:FliG C-terminal domain-containing protein [Marinospirillum perlucidum]
MKPQLITTDDELYLELGPCSARFTQSEAEAFRDLLATKLGYFLEQPAPSTDAREKRLKQLQPLAEALEKLEDRQLQNTLKAYPKSQLVTLIRFLRAQLPGISERIFSLLSRRTAQQLGEELEVQGPVPLSQVLPALESLEPLLATEGVFTGIHQKARDYLERLGQLPLPAFQQFLQELPSASRLQLLDLTDQLALTQVNQRCREGLDSSFKRQQETSDKRLNEQEIRQLMSEISHLLKKLRSSSYRSH